MNPLAHFLKQTPLKKGKHDKYSVNATAPGTFGTAAANLWSGFGKAVAPLIPSVQVRTPVSTPMPTRTLTPSEAMDKIERELGPGLSSGKTTLPNYPGMIGMGYGGQGFSTIAGTQLANKAIAAIYTGPKGAKEQGIEQIRQYDIRNPPKPPLPNFGDMWKERMGIQGTVRPMTATPSYGVASPTPTMQVSPPGLTLAKATGMVTPSNVSPAFAAKLQTALGTQTPTGLVGETIVTSKLPANAYPVITGRGGVEIRQMVGGGVRTLATSEPPKPNLRYYDVRLPVELAPNTGWPKDAYAITRADGNVEVRQQYRGGTRILASTPTPESNLQLTPGFTLGGG